MQEIGIDISKHTPKDVQQYLNQEWDYVITVCSNANETCPAFAGKVKHRLHIGFDGPAIAISSEEQIDTINTLPLVTVLIRSNELYHNIKWNRQTYVG